MAAPRHPLGTDRAPTEPLASTSKAPLQDLERGSTVPDERGSADDRGSDKPWEEGKLPGEALARQASRSSRRAGKARDLESGAGDSSDDSDDEEQQDHAGLSPLARCAPTTTTAPTRPPLAKLGSSTSTTTAFTLPSLPSTPDGDPPTPHGLRIDDGNGLASSSKPVLFVLPPSLSSSHAHSHPTITTTSHPSGTTTTEGLGSWKSRSRKGPTIEKKRLAALGFEEELSRDYDFWASAGLTLCNIGGFPGTVLGVLTAFHTGGGSMYAIAWPISGLFMLCLAAVLGEMASTWPVAGAMFTWTFRLCRSSRRLDPWARFLSWIVGSFLLFSHILLQIVITWQFAHNLLGTIGLYTHAKYSAWVTLAICWAILVVSGLVVSSPISRSPWLWRGAGASIIVFFLTVNITLLTQASEIRSARFVFTDYRNDTGFSSKSYVYMLGWVLTCVASGMESAAHIAEDTKSPARTVPLAMFWSVAATYIMGWISICVLLATVDLAGLDPTLQPSIALIANSIPRRHTTLVLVFVLFSFVLQSIAQLLATSRFTWALARESALPFSDFLRQLSQRDKLPLQAIWVVVALAAPVLILLCINTTIISTILLEGAGVSVMAAYGAPAMIYLFCPRDALAGDGRGKWTLRKWSLPAAFLATLFTSVFMIMLCLPTGWPVTPLNASYAAAILAGVPLLGSIAWVFYGNARYAGPIKTTTRWTIGAEVDLPRTDRGSRSRATKGKTGTPSPAAPGGTPLPPVNETTTSAAHGRSAHVFSSFPTLMTHDGPPHSSDEFESGWTDGTGSEGRRSWEESGVTSGTGTGTGTGTDWTQSTGADSRWTSSQQSRSRGRELVEEGVRGRERSAGRPP